jgi:hypothetical protein
MLRLPIWLICISVVGGCGRQAPTQVFEAVLSSPAPRSVVIVDSDEAGGMSRCSWVHFKGTPADLTSLVAAHPFVVQPSPPDDFSSLSPPAWWSPASLGPGRVAYRWDYKVDDDVTETRIVFHDPAKTEMFAVLYSNW